MRSAATTFLCFSVVLCSVLVQGRTQERPALSKVGFNTYDIERPGRPRLLASVVCPGGQGDVSVHAHLLFMSVEQTRGRIDCGTQGVQTPVSAERFRGIRIFDISDVLCRRTIQEDMELGTRSVCTTTAHRSDGWTEASPSLSSSQTSESL